MSQDDRREPRDTDETLELGTAATAGPSGDTAHDGTEHRADDRAGHPADDRTGGLAADQVGSGYATAAGPVEAPRPPRGPRVGTVVWGFLVVACGAAVLASALGAQVDLGLAAIVVLAVAGVTLVVGSVAVGARRRSRG
ncbi:hypothetical protein [Cellulosimicrobium sp. NPDC057127]|uniref:hypothetical protein n=1 Tax=Cellulosimicrobium sp. NPDC057127 TaxID=3346026 RepID=UPI00362E8A82